MALIEERFDLPGNAKMALSVVVNVEEGSEMTIARGDRGSRSGVSCFRGIRHSFSGFDRSLRRSFSRSLYRFVPCHGRFGIRGRALVARLRGLSICLRRLCR